MKLSEPRLILEKAIANNARASKEASDAQSAIDRARAAKVSAEDALEGATAAIERAKEAHAAKFSAGGASGELRSARSKLLEAQDDLEAAKLSFERLTDAVADPERAARKAATALEEAVAAVIAAEVVDERIAEVERLQAALDHKRAVLREISLRQPFLPGNTGVGRRIELFLNQTRFPNEQNLGLLSPEVDAWRAASARLSVDASAVLPGGEDPAPAKHLRLAR
jgi:hypothetical protein